MLVNMEDQTNRTTDYKQISFEKLTESLPVNLEDSATNFSQFRIISHHAQLSPWIDCDQSQMPHSLSSPLHSVPRNHQPINPVLMHSQNIQDMPGFDLNSTSNDIFFSPQRLNHSALNENNDLIGAMNDRNYLNTVYGSTSPIMNNCHCNNMAQFSDQIVRDQEYELFNKQKPEISVPSNATSNGNPPKKQWIENLVGNWVPNQSGTYSPFGASSPVSQVTPISSESNELKELPRSVDDQNKKKPRIVAEVKPMRPTYSDVLIKSAPTSVFPSKIKMDNNQGNKALSKNVKSKSKASGLKRQNSSGSDDHESPKNQQTKKTTKKLSSDLPRRWVSMDNLNSTNVSSDLNNFCKTNNIDKKKQSTLKSSSKVDKTETLNNSKVQNSAKNTSNMHKRPIQINNNLNIINSFSQTNSKDKIEKNQQANNKYKEEKKFVKEKNLKHPQNEKIQQIRKGQRNRKRENRETTLKDIYKIFQKYLNRSIKLGLKLFFWFMHLIFDIMSMSTNLVVQLSKCGWLYMILYTKYSFEYLVSTFSKVPFLSAIGSRIDKWFGNSRFAFWKRLKNKNEDKEESPTSWIKGSLETNITLPSTGEEAMKRLLACKGKDPYSILGVTPTCTDDDIKKYYKRQAFLVHPDKNHQPGAEEAFKILVHAFDLIGEPERRQAFDQTRQVEATWGELSDLLMQLHKKMEQAANSIRCTNCGSRHKRIPTNRPCYAARFCAQCQIRHSAKEGDIWAESRVMGFLWDYYACMEGTIYNVTDWAACQAANLKHLKANAHIVQYRIVLGQKPPPTTSNGKKRHSDTNASKAEFEDFLNNLYSKNCQSKPSGDANGTKGDSRRRKNKRKNK